MQEHTTTRNVMLLDTQDIIDLTSEIEFSTHVLKEELQPTIAAMIEMNDNLRQNLDNFDNALVHKSVEVLEQMDIEYVQGEIITQVVKNITVRLNGMGNIAVLSEQMTHDIAKLQKNKNDLQSVLQQYETKISHAKTFSFLLSVNTVFFSFILGAILSPTIWIILVYINR